MGRAGNHIEQAVWSEDCCTELFLRAQSGDVQAFAELHALLVPVIRVFLKTFNAQLVPVDRDDLMQETLVAVWQRLPSYRGEASVRTFVLAIARNITLKHLSRQQRSPVVCVADMNEIYAAHGLSESPDSQVIESIETQVKIQQAVSKLPSVQRQAIELIRQDIPRSEAVRLANCNPNQFANRLWRGMLTLRRTLRDLWN